MGTVETEIATGIRSHRAQIIRLSRMAREAIDGEKFAEAAKLLAEASGHKQAIDELEFIEGIAARDNKKGTDSDMRETLADLWAMYASETGVTGEAFPTARHEAMAERIERLGIEV